MGFEGEVISERIAEIPYLLRKQYGVGSLSRFQPQRKS